MKSRFFDKKDILLRHSIILLLSLFFTFVMPRNNPEAGLSALLNTFSTFTYITLIWNLNLLLYVVLHKFFRWETHAKQLLVSTVLLAVALPVSLHYLFTLVLFPLIFGRPCDISDKGNLFSLLMSVIITLLVNSIIIGIDFFKHWRKTLTEKEELKRESLSAEFETLKNQVNPHFLFNSLNTLTSLIEDDKDRAVAFVQKLSNVYRYVLSQKDKETVSLGDELTFIKAYLYLNKMRFGENLECTMDVPQEYYERKMATLTLQMLVENCIKHNIIANGKPLHIHIGIEENRVFVRNNLQKKNVTKESNGIGLSNIIHRYKFLSTEEVEIRETENTFEVKVPLLT